MDEEREKGVTIDVNERSIEVENKKIHFVDTPGHKDYLFKALKGATQVDVSILMIDAFKF